MSTPLTVRWERSWSFADLEQHWLALEAVSTPSVFLSWAWLKPWLQQAECEPRPLAFWDGDHLTGLCLWPEQKHQGGWRKPEWLQRLGLHWTGRPDVDSVYFEYNGWLSRPQDQQRVGLALAGFLQHEPWLHLRLPGMEPALAAPWQTPAYHSRLLTEHPAPWLDLTLCREQRVSVLSTLSRNSRQQITRALRGYQALGGERPRVIRPQTQKQALAHFDQMIDWHQRRWEGKGRPGAFATRFVRDFHRQFITEHWQDGMADIPLLQAGDYKIGILYNLNYRGIASSYQGGFVYEASPKLKPGLVSHALIAEDYLQQGFSSYRLLAGADRYKSSLCDCSDTLHWLEIRRSGLLPALADLGERLAGKFLHR